jgi:hypothetical protein
MKFYNFRGTWVVARVTLARPPFRGPIIIRFKWFPVFQGSDSAGDHDQKDREIFPLKRF